MTLLLHDSYCLLAVFRFHRSEIYQNIQRINKTIFVGLSDIFQPAMKLLTFGLSLDIF